MAHVVVRLDSQVVLHRMGIYICDLLIRNPGKIMHHRHTDKSIAIHI